MQKLEHLRELHNSGRLHTSWIIIHCLLYGNRPRNIKCITLRTYTDTPRNSTVGFSQLIIIFVFDKFLLK